jgi:hypothetical protein
MTYSDSDIRLCGRVALLPSIVPGNNNNNNNLKCKSEHTTLSLSAKEGKL